MSYPPLIFGPVPPYNNPPIEPHNFKPRMFFITGITLGQTTTITTSKDMDYVIGQQVRLLIPNGYGCRGLNEITGFVISIPAPNQVVLNIASTGIDPYVDPGFANKPQIVAIGDQNSGIISLTGRVLNSTNIPGSFINISA